MCTLAIYHDVFEDAPLVIAANRDEFLDRPTDPPAPLRRKPPRAFGGQDRVHGGTWLGVNDLGVAAALLNRRTNDPPDPARRSRGLLCLDALSEPSARDARRIPESIAASDYNPYNLLVADGRTAWIATNHDGKVNVLDLEPGLHLITNLDVNDPTCPRIAASYELFAELAREAPVPTSPEFVRGLGRVLSTHEPQLDPRDPEPGRGLCLHLGPYGTRSSTIAILGATRTWTYWHANDAPCKAVHEEASLWESRG